MSERPEESAVVSATDVETDEYDHGKRRFRRTRLGHAAGGEDLGTSLYEVEPGKRTWPPHYHAGNEEALFVLDGELTLWLGSGDDRTEHALEPGDYVALPAGPDHAHEVEATGEETARFLVVSTMNDPDFTVQPDAGKVYLVAGDAPGEYEDRYLTKTLDVDAEVEYWDE
ncbi:MAG: cupin domain-containing protein [Haloarculaceae archaeon]